MKKLAAILWLTFMTSLFAQAPSDFAIGIGDLLEIRVLGVDDFSQDARVGASGTIQMPFVGEIPVQGLAPAQVQARLAGLFSRNMSRNRRFR